MAENLPQGRSLTTGGAAFVGGDVRAGRDAVLRDQFVFNITYQPEPFTLPDPDLAQVRRDYLTYLREAYQYLDFRGLPQVERVVQRLPLDAVYVPLRARPAIPQGETWLRVGGRTWTVEPWEVPPDEKPEPASLAASVPAASFAQPLFADEALNQTPALVVLGDPGAGKSTLLKVLTLILARQAEGPLPILVPLNAYAAALERQDMSLHDFLGAYFAARQHRLKPVGALFDTALRAGQAVVLLDGLDEVPAHRHFLVRLIQDFAVEHVPALDAEGQPVPGNRLVVTSRIVGYREAPLMGARWRTFTLEDFGRAEITQFARRWTAAFEASVHGPTDKAQHDADRECDELLAAIFAHPGVERLASNPLLLTILALIKRQGVLLPRRRVELYELYLRTLIQSWNRARSLDHRPVGPELDYLEISQILAALGLWLRETHPVRGLVSHTALLDWLTQYYRQAWEMPTGPARREAQTFLEAVHKYSNLLVERGKGQYGFLHLTFEELLAAKGIAAQAQLGPDRAVETLLRHLDDPLWHETILLVVGVLGVVSQQPLAAGEILRRLCQASLEGEARGHNVLLAGEALLDVGNAAVGRRAVAQVTHALVKTLQSTRTPPTARWQAGEILGRLGWLPEDLDTLIAIEEPTRRYWMGKYPVTRWQYARFIEDGGYQQRAWWSEAGWDWRTGRTVLPLQPSKAHETPEGWDQEQRPSALAPVVNVTWYEAAAYCRWLTEQIARGRFSTTESAPEAHRAIREAHFVVRLPTETEWTAAAFGPEENCYAWGDTFDPGRANTRESDLEGRTAICTYPQGASWAGLWDITGNVWEWTSSRWSEVGPRRVIRGGSWRDDQRFVGRAARYGVAPGAAQSTLGFRVVVATSVAPGAG